MLEEVKAVRTEEYKKWHLSVFSILDNLRYTFLTAEHRSRVPLELSDDFQSYTDGKKIVVSMAEFFLDPKYNKDFWMLMEKAGTLHECQHLNSTLLKEWDKLVDSFAAWFKQNYDINKSIGRNFAHHITNIIEDGRIENIIVSNYPGYKQMFKIKNGEYWAHAAVKEIATTPSEEFEHFCAQIFAYAKCGGNNAFGIQVYHKKRLEEEFLKIQDDIDRAVASYSCRDCFHYIERILHTIAPYVAELIKDDSDLMDMLDQMVNCASGGESEIDFNQNAEPGQGSMRTVPRKVPKENPQNNPNNQGNGTSKDSGENNDDSSQSGAGKDSGKDNGDDFQSEAGEDSGEGSDNDSQSGKNPDGNSNGSEEKNSDNGSDDENDQRILNNETFEQGVCNFANMSLQQRGFTEEELAAALNAIHNETEKKESKVETQKIRPSRSAKIDSELKATTYSENKILCGKEVLPASLKSQAKKLNQELTKILKMKYRGRTHAKKGQLDTQALWKIPCKEDDFFKQANQRKKPSVAIYLLLDNSGSMSEYTKSVSARHAAAIMEEAFSSLASCKISLFHASRITQVEHDIIRDFNDRGRYNFSYNSLRTVTPCGGNKDGYSIRIATKELLKRNEKRKFLIVLSDGLPSAYNSTEEALNDVRNAVDTARKNGIEVISIPFGSASFISENQELFKFMYRTNIIVADTENIGKVMGDLFKKIIS